MSYKYERGAADYLKVSTANAELYLEIMNENRGEYPSTNIVIPNEDAPRIALEILKAACWPIREPGNTATYDIVDMLSRCVDISDKLAAEAARNKRRDELAQEFYAGDSYADTFNSTQRAIDRIIELESRP